MQEFYAAMHRIVGELMDASNFYIALYDEERGMLNWPFYVDEVTSTCRLAVACVGVEARSGLERSPPEAASESAREWPAALAPGWLYRRQGGVHGGTRGSPMLLISRSPA